jgi:kynurenine formamidase
MLDVDLGRPIDISIPLHFNGPQPNAFGVEPATSSPCVSGSLVGDTRQGGSCNFESYTFIPHCNGTHTECVGHITHERFSVRDFLQDVLIPAVLVSVESEVQGDDRVISRDEIERKIELIRATHAGRDAGGPVGLIVRTMPNGESKLAAEYGGENIPAYFSREAMEFIVEADFRHLLVDLPSIDRIFDDGKLENHRLFWNVEPASFETNSDSRIHNTITELIYVPDHVEDGEYLLNLQIAPFHADASPSRPILFKTFD